MLTPRYLANLSDDLVELYNDLESDIKENMFKRLNRLQKVTDLDKYEVELIRETGGLTDDIEKYISKYNDKAKKVLADLWDEALQKATETDVSKFSSMVKRNLSDSELQVLNASVDRLLEPERINKTYSSQSEKFEKVYEDICRMTLTVAVQGQKQFLKTCNRAYTDVSTGFKSWKSAYSDSIVDLAKNGVKTVVYSGSGQIREYSIESAVKMNVLSGINQTASQQTLENCDSLDCDLVEVSAHLGARDIWVDGRPWANHQEWQGKVYCLNGSRYYTDENGERHFAPNFQESCGLGEVDGICGINCRHSYYPYFEGTPREYNQKTLDEYKEYTVDLDNHKISRYEAEQELRLTERTIRNYKTIAKGFELTHNTDDPKYKKALNKLSQWQSRARSITNQTGLNRKYINELIGTPDGIQPRGIKAVADKMTRLADTSIVYPEGTLHGVTQGNPMSFRKADNGHANPNLLLDSAYHKNCQTCVVVHEARLRGFNVQALGNYKGSILEKLSRNTRLAWKTSEGKIPEFVSQPIFHRRGDLKKWLDQSVEKGGRYNIQFSWKKCSYGHIVTIFRQGEEVVLYDPQVNEKTKGLDAVMKYLDRVTLNTVRLLRVDGLEFNKSIVDYICEGAKK